MTTIQKTHIKASRTPPNNNHNNNTQKNDTKQQDTTKTYPQPSKQQLQQTANFLENNYQENKKNTKQPLPQQQLQQYTKIENNKQYAMTNNQQQHTLTNASNSLLPTIPSQEEEIYTIDSTFFRQRIHWNNKELLPIISTLSQILSPTIQTHSHQQMSMVISTIIFTIIKVLMLPTH